MIKFNIPHVRLFVSEIAPCAEFYRDVLKFKPVVIQPVAIQVVDVEAITQIKLENSGAQITNDVGIGIGASAQRRLDILSIRMQTPQTSLSKFWYIS